MEKIFYDAANFEVIKNLISRKESFEIVGLNGVMNEAVLFVEKTVESYGMSCRIYTSGRIAAAGASVASGIAGVVGIASAIGIAAHNIVTYSPDYEVKKHLVDNKISIFYKVKSEENKMSYVDFMGDAYNPETGEIDLEKTKQRAANDKDKCNIIICGATGVGKSTLINAVFGKEIVKAGIGKPITQHLEKIDIPEKGLCLWDTKGIESKDYEDTIKQLNVDLDEQFKLAKNESSLPHIGWVCIKATSERLEERDSELIKILIERDIPVVVVFTKVVGKNERLFVEKSKELLDLEFSKKLNDSYVSINSEEYELDDDIKVPVRGLENLIEKTDKIFPNGKQSARNAFIKAQRVKNKERFNAMKADAVKVVHFAAAAAGTVGASPIPGSDAPLIAAVQSTMIYKINAEFEVDPKNSKMTSILAGVMGVTALAQVGKAIVANLLKFIPAAGTFVGGAISSATAVTLTEAVGHAYISVMEKFFDEDAGSVVFPDNSEIIINVFKDAFSYKK